MACLKSGVNFGRFFSECVADSPFSRWSHGGHYSFCHCHRVVAAVRIDFRPKNLLPKSTMSAKIQEYRQTIERSLQDKNKPWTKYFDQIEAKTGVNRVYVFAGLVAFTGLYLVFGFGAELICNTIGFVYPAYMSMRALESPQKDDDTKWLTYWVVYACFSVVEYFSDIIVGWFPLYWLIKCIFVIWCFMPTEYNGSLIIYYRVIRPYYQKHHDRIDNLVNNASRLVADAVKNK